MITLQAWRRIKTQRTQVFHILVLSFFSWCNEYTLLPSLLRNVCFLMDHLYTGVLLNREGLPSHLFAEAVSRLEVFCKIHRLATLLKRRLWHRCFPVNFSKFPRTPLFTEQLRRLLLYLNQYPYFENIWINCKSIQSPVSP